MGAGGDIVVGPVFLTWKGDGIPCLLGLEGSWALRHRTGKRTVKTITSRSSPCAHLAHALDWAEKHFSGSSRIGKGIQGGRNCMYGGTETGRGELAAGETERG